MFTKEELEFISRAILLSAKSYKRAVEKSDQPVAVREGFRDAMGVLIRLNDKVIAAIKTAK